ncbi:MAG: YgiQ family radical SAM protein [Clostridium sp.]|nr:YgiQ family radical SAM protein [Clostridium sp.]MCM1170611.1 YgiQ family radical SAM protein [Clostridium sp.]MCM1207318.1 YgiQ family radical SAM protein [Ruminococcus sp.]
MNKFDYEYDDGFLPLNREEMELKGWEQPDFVYVIGDAYVDHSSFGHAIISRMLELYGYKVAIISQPDWKNPVSIDIYGRPRLAYLVTAGNMDSMVNHYSVSKRKREHDSYTPGGVMGKRPDYATVVYCNLIRRKYKDVPIIIGGIEASLRRLAHYDYWSNHIKHSILIDSQADILIYGMGEKAIVEIAEALDNGIEAKDICFVEGTAYRTTSLENAYDYIELPAYDELKADKINYAKSFKIQYENTDHYTAKALVEKYNDHMYVVQNKPAAPLTEHEMDRVYSLPYKRTYHPSYEALGGVPAISEVKFSLVSSRGCFGGCSFCALTFHQGRIIQTRSDKSILQEAEKMVWEPDFKGYIHDVGGPTANFRVKACKKQEKYGVCKNRQCLFPKPCENLIADHSSYLGLLRKLRELPNVKKVFIRSGIRFDYLMADKNDEFFYELCKYHVSGQLKVAPEHVSDNVLRKMGKPGNDVFQAFCDKYKKINEELGMKQYMVPYLMSSHPGSTMQDAVKLAEYLRNLGYMPEQVQDFYPTPSTISTCMYYTGVDPRTMEEVYVPRSPHEKAMQRALIQYRNPKNYDLVHEALVIAKRTDLIGYDKKCLIRPRKNDEAFKAHGKGNGEGHRADNVKYGGGFTENKENMKNGDGKRKKKTIRNIHKKKKK